MRGRDDENLWTGNYDGRVDELLDLQHTVGLAVAREVGVRLGSAGGRRPTAKPESQVAYLKGSSFAGQWRLEEAIASFQLTVSRGWFASDHRADCAVRSGLVSVVVCTKVSDRYQRPA